MYQSPYSDDPRHSKKALTTASPQTTQVTEACDDDSYNTNTRLSHNLFLIPDDDQQPLQINSLCVYLCVCVWLVVGLDYPYVSVSGYSVSLGYPCVRGVVCCLQCFDAVGWVAGRASSL